ncbi:MAG: hypothetical protein ACTSQI_21470 [Candidatus Helarchaeota archaeon]
MSNIKWQLKITIELISASIILYILYFTIFHDLFQLELTFLSSLAYSPIQVLLVTFFINQILKNREKKLALQKLYTNVGVFFHEVGLELLKLFKAINPNTCKRLHFMDINNDWNSREFDHLIKILQSREFRIEMTPNKLFEFLGFFESNKTYFLDLLENPNLMEHDLFTDMLWGMFHFYKELELRKNLVDLPEHDVRHLTNDAERVYKALLIEWVTYLRYLKEVYPFLYSFAIRTNPFKADLKMEDVIIK